MDITAEKTKLEMERDAILSYLDHPITKKILADNRSQEEEFVKLICDLEVVDIASFFAHFAATGHLRGLRRSRAIIMDDLEEIEEKLKEIQ
jgi:hypothetical protein